MPSRGVLGVAWAGCLIACAPGGTLTVQLASDMTPGIEIDHASVSLTGADGSAAGADVTVALDAHRSLGRPVRLALYSELPPGDYTLSLDVTRGSRVVQSRVLRVHVDGNVVRTLLLTRDCGGVMCPGAGDPSAMACLGGRCVDPTCSPEDPTRCGMPACTTDASCAASTVACAPARCLAGTCVAVPDDALCTDGQRCDSVAGCVAVSTACDWSTTPTLTTPALWLDTPLPEMGLAFSRDALDLYFAQEIAPTSQVLVAHRASLDAPFTTSRALTELHTPDLVETSFAFRRDGLEVVYVSEPLGGGATLSDVFFRQRTSLTEAWSSPMAITSINTADYEFDTWLEPDGLTLWLERQGPSVETDVYRTHRARFDAEFDPPTRVPGLSEPGRIEANPTLPDDGSFVVVTTGTVSDLDLAYTRIVDGAVGALVPLDALNSPTNDSEPLVRADGCEVLFVSHRGGMGGAAIYRSTVVR